MSRHLALVVTIFLAYMSVSLPFPLIAPLFLSNNAVFANSYNLNASMLLGMVLFIFPFAQFITVPLSGLLADKYGRKNLLITLLAISLFGMIITGLSIYFINITLLLMGRFLCGIGEGCIAIIYAMTSEKSTGTVKRFSDISIATNTGYTLGPILGGVMGDVSVMGSFTNPALPFFISAGLYLLNILIVILVINKEEVRKTNKTKVVDVFKTPNMLIFLLIIFLGYYAINIIFMYFAPFVVISFNATAYKIGIYTSLFSVILIIAGAIVKYFASNNLKLLLLMGFAFMSISVIVLNYVSSELLLIIPCIFASMGIVWFEVGSNSMISKIVDAKDLGKSMGIYRSFCIGSEMTAGLLGGLLLGMNVIFPFLSLLVILPVICLFVFKMKVRS